MKDCSDCSSTFVFMSLLQKRRVCVLGGLFPPLRTIFVSMKKVLSQLWTDQVEKHNGSGTVLSLNTQMN